MFFPVRALRAAQVYWNKKTRVAREMIFFTCEGQGYPDVADEAWLAENRARRVFRPQVLKAASVSYQQTLSQTNKQTTKTKTTTRQSCTGPQRPILQHSRTKATLLRWSTGPSSSTTARSKPCRQSTQRPQSDMLRFHDRHC